MSKEKFDKKSKIYNVIIVRMEDSKKVVLLEKGLSYEEAMKKYEKYLKDNGFSIYNPDTHICGTCKNMLRCPKVMDKYKLQVSYENYPFILGCFQMISDESGNQEEFEDSEYFIPSAQPLCEQYHINSCKYYIKDRRAMVKRPKRKQQKQN